MAKDPRILYFCAGDMPTARDKLASLELGSNVSFRNGNFGTGGAAVEHCDGVSGPAIPKEYSNKPDGAECFKAYRAKLIEEAERELQAAEAAATASEKPAPAPTPSPKPGKPATAVPAAPVGNPGAAAGWTAGQ